MEVDENVNVVTFSKNSLYEIFAKVDQNNKMGTDKMGTGSSTQDYYNGINANIPEKCQLSLNSNNVINNSIRCYKDLKKRKKISGSKISELASKDTIFSIEYESNTAAVAAKGDTEPPPPPKKSRGPQELKLSISKCYKPFEELTDKQKRNITKPLISMLESFIEVNEFDLDVNQLLGYLICRQNGKNKHVAQFGNDLLNESVNDNKYKASFTDIEAVAFMHSLALSKEETRKVRYFLAAKQVEFPPSNKLLSVRKSLHPTTKSVLDGKGRSVDFSEVVSCTAASLVRVVKEVTPGFSPSTGKLTFHFKDGGDGAGTMARLKSKKAADDAEHIFQYGLTPLRLTQTSDNNDVVDIWNNKTPNSPHALRPIYLIREKEDDPNLLNLVIKQVDAARKTLNEDGFEILVDGEVIKCSCVIKDTMKDLKFKTKISGLGGAACLLCKSEVKDWTHPERSRDGFKIDRTAADTYQIFLSVIDANGDIRTAPRDFERRSGVTKEPISDSDQHCITITHSYINGCSWFLKIMYRCHADYPIWVERAGYKQVLDSSKNKVRDTIKEKTGLMLGYVCTAGAKGGTSTDGKQARRFFSDELTLVLSELLSKNNNRKHKENVLLLHKQLSLILRVISCTRQIDTEKFARHCQETTDTISSKFPWVRLCDTLHGSIQHSAELIEMNGGFGLGWYSEEGLEANNKDIRKYLEQLSRKTDSNSQIEDVHHRLLERSDPYIVHIISLFKQTKVCRICDSTDHTVRSHDRYVLQDVEGIGKFFIESETNPTVDE